MDANQIKIALADISADKDLPRKAAKLASLCSALFRENGFELVVVGGSAIELFTDGAYMSGDLDPCPLVPAPLSLRKRTRVQILGT